MGKYFLTNCETEEVYADVHYSDKNDLYMV